jgi:hypothetical protein
MRESARLKNRSIAASAHTRRLQSERPIGASASREEGMPGFAGDEAPEEPPSILGGPAQRWAMFATIGTCLAVLLSYWVLMLNR